MQKLPKRDVMLVGNFGVQIKSRKFNMRRFENGLRQVPMNHGDEYGEVR